MTESHPRRTPRQPADETRRRMLEAAVRFVTEHGLELDFANLNLEEFIRVAGVPRSTVFRIWPDRNAFVADLIGALFDANPEMGEGFDEETFQVVERVIEEHADELRTAEGRARLLALAARLGGERNVQALQSSRPWHVYRSILAAAMSGSVALEGDALHQSLQALEERFLARMADMFAHWAEVFQRRMLPGLTFRDVALCSASVVEGMVERRFLGAPDGPRRVGVGADAAEWEVGALALYAIFTTFSEEI